MSKYYVGIDIGTYETKGVLIDDKSRIISTAVCKHNIETPFPGWYEHDAEQVWWRDFCAVSQTLLSKANIGAGEIAGVGASTLGSDCLPVDAQCRPLRKAILYGIDSRAQQEIAEMTEYYGKDRVKALFGRPICTGDVAAKILWLKHHEPEVYYKTYKFLTGASYITAKLTGEYVVDQFLSRASFRPLYTKDGAIDEIECKMYCRPDQLAQPRVVTDIAGHVSAAAARETGLPEGTPVITGTGDSTAEAISVGVLEAGDMMLQFGSTLFIYCATDHLVEDDRIRGNCFTIPNLFSIAAGTNTCGTLTRWYRDELFPDAVAREEDGGTNAFEAMLEGLETVPAGSDGLIMLPYFAGERTPINDPNAKGAIFGLKLSHTRAHLYRSALESVGYSIAQHIDILRECGVAPSRIMAVGGGAKNRLWMQMIADIIGLPIHISEVSIGASFGDALMAALGTGRFQSFSDLRSAIHLKETLRPNPDNFDIYQRFRAIYQRLYLQTKDLMHQL